MFIFLAMFNEFFKQYGIGFGTYHLRDETAVKKAISLGYRVIDTAESYATEKIVGSAIKLATRKKLFIISKVSPNHLSYKDVLKSAVESVKKLDTFIDLYLIHQPNPNISLKETFLALKKLKDKHIIRHYGISNFDLKQTKVAYKYRPVANENEFSLEFQYTLPLVNFCNSHGMLFFSYRPFYAGELINPPLVNRLTPFARKYHVSPSNIALRWIIQHKALPIVGSSDIDHLKENLNLNFLLSDADMLMLSNAFSEFR